MQLREINRILRLVGLVLVISYDPQGEELTRLWIERWETYQARCVVAE